MQLFGVNIFDFDLVNTQKKIQVNDLTYDVPVYQVLINNKGGKNMPKESEYMCPYYHRIVDDAECYDMFMVAARFFKNEDLVHKKDRDALYKTCLKCGKHGCD